MYRLAWAFLIILTLGPRGTANDAKLVPVKIDAIARSGLTTWKAPGMALAIVLDDEIYLGGYGHRERGKDAVVTSETIFAYASLTKAFASASLGILVDDGKANWDDPVRDHLNWFRLKDPLADRDVRLRDLLCHRTGLSRHDLLWYRAPWSIEETVRRMAYLEPTSSFRSRFEYNNLAYSAAGLAIGKTAGMPWHEFVRKRLLTPLGMKDIVFSASEAKASKNHATPHQRDTSGNIVPIDWYPDDRQIRAAGSMKGSVRDLVPWMKMHLNGGVLDGKRILSAKTLAEIHSPQIVVPLNPRLMPAATQCSYALGWLRQDYRGRLILDHGGANDGFRARIVLVPSAKLGLVVLTNCEEHNMVQDVSNRLLDLLLNLEARDWTAFYMKLPEGSSTATLPKQITGTKPSRGQTAYVGKYRDPACGELTVTESNGTLTLAWSGYRMRLQHYHYDTFQMCGKERLDEKLDRKLATFSLNADGNMARVVLLGRTFTRQETTSPTR